MTSFFYFHSPFFSCCYIYHREKEDELKDHVIIIRSIASISPSPTLWGWRWALAADTTIIWNRVGRAGPGRTSSVRSFRGFRDPRNEASVGVWLCDGNISQLHKCKHVAVGHPHLAYIYLLPYPDPGWGSTEPFLVQ